ncbi:VanW family protein [Streptomyces griseomycini]|uniref:Vancomycin resistance protein YoaR n=1 Tax=Streptomyces griseomycini TaxID=66895 RepID=A0A7W7V9E9_9ACTN|nr:VanW family protein [Streptomyces griseomycini]MBB4901861.1 vancomycin resistance protein YoaR [Streptomyces griseomycini]GGQ17220.1 vanomycin resistance protein VanB [Streptomyces griseomycini]GGR40819.1 vanomycin resistance protein VanB [Streptomyces griseomycini]
MRPRIPFVPRTASLPPVALAGGALTVGIGGLYLAGLLLTGGEIEAGTTVRGVDIGGLTREEAARKLEQHLVAAGPRKLAVKVGDRRGTVDPRQAGFAFDVRETLDRAASTGADPVGVIGGLFRSGGDIEPVVRVDEDKARATLGKLSETLDQRVRDGAVSFAGGRVEQTAPRTGYALDADAAIGALRAPFLRGAADSVTVLPAHETRPKVTAEEVRRAVREFAQPAMSAPVALTAGGKRFTITPAVLGEHLTMRPDGAGRLAPDLDGKGLRATPAVAGALNGLPATPRNARLGLEGDEVVVTADARPGVEVTDKALGKAVLPLLTESGTARTGEVETRRIQPEVTRENAARLGLTEKMSSFTVEFEPAAYRTTNVGRAVELINGSVVMPNETWSFNRTVGERTEANGFVDGIMIFDDQYTKAPGGGVSAVATTVFNAMFFAGVKPVEHGAHSFYIERYPEGREATVAWGSLDLRFTNDSGKAVYIQAESTDTSLTVSFLGTKKYDEITSVKGPRTHVQQPETKVSTDEQCVPQTPLEGFDVTVERVFHDGGREVKREPFRTHYTPRDEIVCEEAPGERRP